LRSVPPGTGNVAKMLAREWAEQMTRRSDHAWNTCALNDP
jgi:hypothetical protein